MQLKAKASLVAAACVAAGIAVLAPATPAFAATPICTTYATVHAPSGYYLVLPTTASGSANCYLAQGANSAAVRVLQDSLNSCMGANPVLAVDGDYGPATRNAVLAVQKKYGLTRDGVYGAQTRGAMSFKNPGVDIHCWSYS